MPMEDFLAGTALFLAMLAAVGAATALVVHRRLSRLDPLARALAAVVVGTAVLIGVHLVPLLFGILSRGTVLAACAAAVGLAALVRPARDGAAELAPPPAQAAGGPASWALAGIAAAFALAAALADLARWGGDELVGVDPLTFHLPNVGRWIQTGSLWQIDQFVPLQAHGNYPNNGDVVLLSTVLPWHNDFLVRLPIAFFLAVTAVAVYAVARELRAPPAAAVLAGAAAISIPVVGIAAIPRALPDPLLWATLSIGVLFGLRRGRTGRTSDLVLAGAALGIAAGTKWYGVSSVAVVVVVWTLARMLPRGAGMAGALRDGVAAGGLAFLGVAVWFARNLVESGNPVFPVKVAPFGVTLFDAPPDVLRGQVGFSIADYLGDPDVLSRLAREVYEGLGAPGIAAAIAVLAALVLARRRDGGRPALVMAITALGLLALYAVTPYTALGLRDDPSLASVNTRYAVPALLLALPLAAWLAGRLPRVAAGTLEAGLALAVVLGARGAYAVQARDLLAAALVLAVLGAAGWVLWRVRDRRPVLVAAALFIAVAGLAGAHRMQERINDGRYLGADPAIDALLRAAPADRRIGLAADWSVGGLSPIWPSFGTRIANHVEYIGYFDGFLRRYPTRRRFQAALRTGRYDVIVVGRGFYPPQDTPEQRWAIAAGWHTIALSDRL
ncbi:MAG TPA: glycosyltransferase family 39 protein, partial [Solirubrobacteraceae bacterium]|nr:glycosyltransferase family 39 protein [Solirubrobacteraceae bacterium]